VYRGNGTCIQKCQVRVYGHPVFLICFVVFLSVFEEVQGQYLDHITVASFQTLSSSLFAIQYAIDDV